MLSVLKICEYCATLPAEEDQIYKIKIDDKSNVNSTLQNVENSRKHLVLFQIERLEHGNL